MVVVGSYYIRLKVTMVPFLIRSNIESGDNFLGSHILHSFKHNYRNYWKRGSVEWNGIVVKEYLFQLTLSVVDDDCVNNLQLKRDILVDSCLQWIDKMAKYLCALSPWFVCLPSTISKLLHSSAKLSLCSTIRIPLVLTKILQASRGNQPEDLLHLILPEQRQVVGPWLFKNSVRRSDDVQETPFRFENLGYPSMKRNRQTRVEIVDLDCKEDGFVIMRSKFTVMSRFLFWFYKQAKLDIWTSYFLSFKTECCLSEFFRINSLSQLEAEIDWLTQWVKDNDVNAFDLPGDTMKVDVLVNMKKFLRASFGPVFCNDSTQYNTKI